MHTPVLTAVSKPTLFIGIPLRALFVTVGVLLFVWSFGFSPIVGIVLAGLLHAFFIQCTFKDPHFDKVWMAPYRQPATVSLLPTKGHRYAGW